MEHAARRTAVLVLVLAVVLGLSACGSGDIFGDGDDFEPGSLTLRNDALSTQDVIAVRFVLIAGGIVTDIPVTIPPDDEGRFEFAEGVYDVTVRFADDVQQTFPDLTLFGDQVLTVTH